MYRNLLNIKMHQQKFCKDYILNTLYRYIMHIAQKTAVKRKIYI